MNDIPKGFRQMVKKTSSITVYLVGTVQLIFIVHDVYSTNCTVLFAR